MPPSVDAPPDLSGLLELSRIENLDLKPVILRVQTDLFVRAPGRDRTAIEIFESLACGLIPTVDDALVTPHTEAFHAVVWHCLVSHPVLQQNRTKW